MPKTVRLTERTTPFVGARVDREAGVIRDALICGNDSANGRDYLPACFGDGKQYEGAKSFLNHSRNGRQVQELVGWWENVRVDAGRPRGDFHVLKTAPHGPMLLEAAERNPAVLGFSHVADCEADAPANGRQRVRRVVKVESVDLVIDPATTKSLFESASPGAAVKKTLKKLAESLFKKAGPKPRAYLAALAEDDTFGAAEMDPPAAGTDPDEVIDTAFVAALHAAIDAYDGDGMTGPELVAKVKELVKLHDKVGDDDEPAADPPADEPTKTEGKQKPAAKPAGDTALSEAVEAADKAGVSLTGKQFKLLAAVPAAFREEQLKLIGDATAATAGPAKEPARSTPRTPGGTGHTAEGRDKPPPTDGRKFAEHVGRR